MRLGELLVADGRLTEEQVEQGLRAQVLWGGRLGTNLVELGLIDLDDLSWTLARLHRVPVALARHFAQPDAALQQRLGAALAEKWQCVPLAKLADDPPRIGVAVTAPLSDDAIAEIAAQLGEATDAIVVAIAAEMRILYHLEFAYGIARPARYLRTRDGEPPEPPPAVFGDASEAELELPGAAAAGRDDRDDAAIAEPPPLDLPSSEFEVATGPELRRYMPMVGDEERRVGRIAIRRVKVYAADAADDGDADSDEPGTWAEALRTIRRAHDRDRVGDLAVAALTRFCARLQVAALLVVRGQVAIGWLGHHREGALDIRSLAVPLDQPSAIAAAVSRGCEVRWRDGSGADIDQRLAVALGAAGGRGVVVPISLSEGRVACLLYCKLVRDGAGAAGADLDGERAAPGDRDPAGERDDRDDPATLATLQRIEEVAAATRSAFLRLIRAASR
jgi:Type II secretion system (T2SS), protein E, N-terminal domain